MATPIPKNRASFTIDEIVRATNGTFGGRRTGPRPAADPTGFVTDSRAVVPGSVFVALRGENHDGHAFLLSAVERGAQVVVVARAHTGPTAFELVAKGVADVVEVKDTLVAWGDLARAHLARWREKDASRRVVAITGSAGKTTTKELTAALLGAVASTHFTAGNLNNRVGVPSVVLALEDTHRFCVLEMGMSLPGELDAIAAFAHPDVSVVTNVGLAHAEGVGGREGVMREKGAVYRALDERGVAIVNADDDFAIRAASGTRGRAVTFGRSNDADYRLLDRTPDGEGGSRVRIAAKGRALDLRLPLPGDVAAIDLAAALAAQEAASGELLTSDAIDAALAAVRLSGRATLKKLGGDVVVLDDTYNANPGSMRAALATLVEIAGTVRRTVAVLGEMKELGALTDEEHVSLGDAIADAKVELAIGCGGKIDLALDRAAARGIEVVRARSTEEAAAESIARVRAGDAILVKASRSVGAEKVVEALGKATESLPLAGKSALSKSS